MSAQMTPRAYNSAHYGAYGGFANGSGPKMEASILSLKGMLVSDLDIITKLGLPLVPDAQKIMAKVSKALMIINREKELDQWGSAAHDTVDSLKAQIVREQSLLATKMATAKPITISPKVPTGGGTPYLSTTNKLVIGSLIAALVGGAYFMGNR